MKRLILTAAIVASLASLVTALVSALTSAAQQAVNHGTSITGRVVSDSGQPMPNTARVIISGSSRQGVRRTISTDETGRFVADNLPRGSYAIVAQANGYVLVREPATPFTIARVIQSILY